MATKEKTATDATTVNSNEQNKEAITVRNNVAMQAPENFDLAFAELTAEFDTAIKGLGVTNIVSPTSLISSPEPLEQSAPLNLTDAFTFEITEAGASKDIIIFVCNPVGSNEVLTVGQSVNPSRLKFVTAFAKAKTANAKLTMTNMVFKRLDKGKKSGNYPIILTATADTQPLVTQN